MEYWKQRELLKGSGGEGSQGIEISSLKIPRNYIILPGGVELGVNVQILPPCWNLLLVDKNMTLPATELFSSQNCSPPLFVGIIFFTFLSKMLTLFIYPCLTCSQQAENQTAYIPLWCRQFYCTVLDLVGSFMWIIQEGEETISGWKRWKGSKNSSFWIKQ